VRVCSASRVARHTITRKHPAAPPPLVAPPHTVSRSNHVATAFRRTPGCEVLVYYPIEKRSSCVLCKDLHTFAKTAPDAQTRAYLTTPAPPPPARPGISSAASRNYHVVDEPHPPPVYTTPSPPSPPPAPLSHLGRHKGAPHTQCTFYDAVEFSVERTTGFTDRVAGSKEECCDACGKRGGCKDFVFEPATGVCVLLPSVLLGEIERRDNEFV
jgi:hypothetical protein